MPLSDPSVKTGFRVTAIFGILGVIALFAGGLFWAVMTDISGAVIAQGAVEVVGKPKSVQHLDGGIVEEILVTDGGFVEQNAVLLRLDDTLLTANLHIYKTRLSEALALRDRLIAEQKGADIIGDATTDPVLIGMDTSLNRSGQAEIFKARQDLEHGRREQLAEKIRQFENQTLGVDGLIKAKERQLELLEKELTSMEQLANSGLVRAPQLMALQRSQADILGQISEHHSELARIQNSIRDTELEVLQGQRQLKEEIVTELRDVTTGIHELRQQVLSTGKQLTRISIRAPNAGRVHEMQTTTIGGVIAPGATILQIISLDQGVAFQLKIDPSSVDKVFVGQDTTLRFPAFNARTTPELAGAVADISPTSVRDEMTGMMFFRVTVTASDTEIARLGDRVLVPGMPVEAFLKTGERSVISYLVKPIQEQLMQAFRED